MSEVNSTIKKLFFFKQVVMKDFPTGTYGEPETYVRIGFHTGNTSSSLWMRDENWEALKTVLLNESEEAIVRIQETKRYREAKNA